MAILGCIVLGALGETEAWIDGCILVAVYLAVEQLEAWCARAHTHTRTHLTVEHLAIGRVCCAILQLGALRVWFPQRATFSTFVNV